MMQTFDELMRKGGAAALEHVGRFMTGEDKVTETLRRISSRLEDLAIPYAIAGGMALAAYGYVRSTNDVDILVTAGDLQRVHDELEGLGYLAPFGGSKNLRDTSNQIRIEFIVTGAFAGDGKPKPIAFPDPADVAVDIDGVKFLNLPTLIELKLASGLTGGIDRMKDLTDVVELIKVLKLPRDLGLQLSDYVRAKYVEFWDALHPA